MDSATMLIVLLVMTAVLDVGDSEGFVPSTCNAGQYVTDSGCKMCNPGFYQPENLFGGRSCASWTERPSKSHWILLKEGTTTTDSEWDCEPGYEIIYVSSTLPECAKVSTTTASTRVMNSTEGSTPTPPNNSSGETTTDNQVEKEDNTELIFGLTIGGVSVGLVVVVLVMYVFRRYYKKKDENAGDIVENGSPLLTQSPEQPHPSLDVVHSNISKQFCYTLSKLLGGKSHDFINVLEDPSNTFNSEEVLRELKHNGKDFFTCGYEALLKWEHCNYESDPKPLIADALKVVGWPELLKLAETQCRSGADESNGESSTKLNRLFYKLVEEVPYDKIEAFLRQLPNDSSSFNASSVLDGLKKNEYGSLDTCYIETLRVWRKKNRWRNLRSDLHETLLSVNLKVVTENQDYIAYMDSLCPVEPETSGTSVPTQEGEVGNDLANSPTADRESRESEGREQPSAPAELGDSRSNSQES